MKSVQKLETSIHRCLEMLTQLRAENERLSLEIADTRQRLSTVSDEHQVTDQKKQQVIAKITELAERIERLQIDSISNE